MMAKEATDRASRIPAVEHTFAKLQRMAHKHGSSVMATSALVLKPCLIVRLREQHIIDRIDLVTCEVMVVQKPTEIVDVVWSLQLATGNAEKLTGEVTGMPMTGSTTVVPQPVQVYIGSPDRRHRQHRRNQYDAYSQTNSHSVCACLQPALTGLLYLNRYSSDPLAVRSVPSCPKTSRISDCRLRAALSRLLPGYESRRRRAARKSRSNER